MKADVEALTEMGIPSSLLTEMANDGVEEIYIRQGIPDSPERITLGTYTRYFKCIDINARLPKDDAVKQIKDRTGIDLSKEEIFTWVALHEFAHHKRLNESMANEFASDRISVMRGFVRKHTLKLNVDIEALVKKGIKDSFSDSR